MKKFLITGSAGFIGFSLAKRLLSEGHEIVGIDHLNSYYSVELKKARNAELKRHESYEFHRIDVSDREAVGEIFARNQFDAVFHLAAQAGVRYSLENPWTYIKSNVEGTLAILEAARHSSGKPHLLVASSSSVYGLSKNYPFREDDPADRPAALYGATKRECELMGHAYSHLFGLRVTMLRFFTVYGPWGRPDMALFMFVKNILDGEEIEVFNGGDMIRDFTYVDDIVEGMIGLEKSRIAPEQPLYDVFNIGSSSPRRLLDFIGAIEKALGKKARIKMMPFQPGDVYRTYADVSKLKRVSGYSPKTSIEEGIAAFVKWYRVFYS